ncbi:MAG: AlbA family DNA-binding domain-containing protein [Acidobacteriota bacterium]
MTQPDDFRKLLESPEGARVEFKSASGGFHFDELVKYCVALANEGNGKIVLGITDRRPRRVLGTRAFSEPGRTEAGLFERLGHRIPLEEYKHEGKRVLIVHVPGRLPGTAWQDRGTFWMRSGDAVVPMSDERLRRIHEEAGPDFSAEICSDARLSDLDPAGIEQLRRLWQQKVPGQDIGSRSDERVLTDAELLVGGHFVWAALILLGTREALGRLFGHAETFSTEDFLVVDLVHRDRPVPDYLRPRGEYLLEQGVLERVGRGRGVHFLLSRRFYRLLGKPGVYTRKRGLDRDQNKALLLRHIESSARTGARFEEFRQVLPALSRHQVQTLVRELKRAGQIVVRGSTKAARWFPADQKRNSTQ